MFVNPSDVKIVFGNRLAIARKMRGLSLQELADLTGNVVTKQAISKYEKGLMAPTPGLGKLGSEFMDSKGVGGRAS